MGSERGISQATQPNLSAFLGFAQEYRASRVLSALKRMAAPLADVVREGQEQSVPARDIVPGDIVVLAVGDRVPADIDASSLI